jgi:hypothetical protein
LHHIFSARIPPEVNPFCPLPSLRTGEEKQRVDKYNTPFPCDRAVFEDLLVDHWKVDDRKVDQPTENHRPKEEFVPPYVMKPLGPDSGILLVASEKGMTEVYNLPREEEGEPGEADECS